MEFNINDIPLVGGEIYFSNTLNSYFEQQIVETAENNKDHFTKFNIAIFFTHEIAIFISLSK